VVHTLSSPERDLLTVVRGFVDNEVAPAAARHEAESSFPRGTFEQLGALDLLGLAMPTSVGGSDVDYRTYLLVLEELARGHATLALAVSVHTLVMKAILHAATEEQASRLLPPMVHGDALGAFCLSEPDAGSDAASLATRAVRTDDGWVLNGTKAWVTHGGHAQTHIVFARTGDSGAAGISAFAVGADVDGLVVAKHEDKMGLRGSPTAQLTFTDALVDDDSLLGGEPGRGFRTAMAGLDTGRLGIAAIAVGLAQCALDHAVAYARQREQFGRPVIDFQGLQFLLADMATQLEAARSLYKDAASRLDAGLEVSKVCSMAKLFATDMAMQVTTDAVQVLGGVGYTRDFPVERLMREAKVMQIFEGTNQIQRMVIGRRLAAGT
jgi:alkylation response protein AidB-like acyl-CoA dehydrogenase